MKQPIGREQSRQAAENVLPLTEHAYRVIHDRIVRLELAPGEKLKIAGLQEAHDLSSSPLREALNRLVQEGLVRADDGRGFFVASVSIPDLRDIGRLRTMLDTEALGESIRSGTDEWEAGIVAGFHRLELIEGRFGTGAVRLDGEVLGEDDLDLAPERLDGAVLQVGKRRIRRLIAAR